ncbi:MAG TPA: ATP-binding protein [Candidatus Ozemobacteraceae bacterium]|nr:ATP-binding protein [Candidatus Ozemobacteraceae bacterium]
MRIAPKLSLLFVLASLLPLLTIGYAGTYLIERLGERAVVSSRDNAIESEKTRLAQLVQDKAQIVRDFLAEYHRDVVMLRNRYERFCCGSAGVYESLVQSAYRERDTAGLPAYGYVHPENGAYGNWDGLGYDGVLWVRRTLTKRVREDPAFRAEATGILNCMARLMPWQLAVLEKHRDSCDLVWVVSTTGIVSTCPDEYTSGIASNPDLADLDETNEEYLTLFTPGRNPSREVRWMQPYLDEIKKIWMISCVTPLYCGDRFLGTLGVDVTIQNLVEWLRELHIGRNGYAFMISSTGAPLALPEAGIDELACTPLLKEALRESCRPYGAQSWNDRLERALQDTIADGCPVSLRHLYVQMVAQKTGVETIEFPGGKKIVAYCPIGQAGWSIGLVLPIEEALSALQPVLAGIDSARADYTLFLTSFIVISALIAAVLGAWGGRRFAGPVNELISSISSISKGNAWKDVESGSYDELRNLADSANVMVRQIAENEQMLEVLFNGVSDAIFVHDSHGAIIRVNDRMCEMFQCTRSQALEMSLEITSSGEPPYTLEDGRRWIERALAGESPVFEWRSRDLTGRVFWTEVALRRVVLSGEPCVIATVRDISARKEADEKLRHVEEQLRQAQKLESVGRLAGGVAHDFNNMLTPVLGYAQIMKQMIPASDRLRPMVDHISTAGNRCRALISQLLAFARKQVMCFRYLDLNSVIRDFMPMLHRTLREDIRVECRFTPEAAGIMGDSGQIEQVVLNLALNSQDAMPNGGDLIFETRFEKPDKVFLEAHPDISDGLHVVFTVRDTGVGMTPEEIGRMFEPFFTTHGHGSGKGTGLGLAIVHGIVQQHSGCIAVTSEVGKGTVVEIFFPAAQVSPEAAHPAAEDRPKTVGGNETILIVEDQDMVRNLTLTMLEELGYRTFAVSSGAEAIAVARREGGKIDMVLMDVILPDMTGKQVGERIREELEKPLKILYMSGYTADVIGNHGVLEPGTMFIQKPFEIGDLAGKIRETLASSG